MHGRQSAEQQRIEELARVNRFHDFTDEEIQQVVEAATYLTVPEHWALMVEQQPADKAYLILAGEVSVRRHGEEVARLGAGEVIGEMALVNHKLRSATVVADTPAGGPALHGRDRRPADREDPALPRRPDRRGRGTDRPRPGRLTGPATPGADARGVVGRGRVLVPGRVPCAGHPADGSVPGVNLFEFEGKRPSVHPEAFVAPTATLIGDVTVEQGASVWYGAVLRADICAIVVRSGANVQDNSVLHAAPDQVVEIRPGATVAHTCVVHGAVLEENALLGNGSTILDGAVLGAGSMVAAGSLVTPGTQIPSGVLAAGAPAQVRKPIEGTSAQFWVEANPSYYAELAQRHRTGVTPV